MHVLAQNIILFLISNQTMFYTIYSLLIFAFQVKQMSNAGNQLDGVLQRSNNESVRFKYLRISTRELSSGIPCNFSVNFGNDIGLSKVGFVQAVNCVFPNLGNNINSTNNVLRMECTGVEHTITIPIGYYTATTLGTAIANAVNAFMGTGWLTVSLSPFGYFVFATLGGIAIDTVKATSPMASYLGFTELIFAAPTIVATTLPNLVGMTVLYIHSSTISNNATYLAASDATPGGANSGNVNDVNGYLTIPVTCAYGGQQSYDFGDSQKIVLGSPQGMPCRNLNFTLRTNGGRLYTELGAGQEFILTLKCFML